MSYYTLENGNLKKAGSVIRTAKGYVTNPSAEDYAEIGAYPRDEASFAPPATDEGYHAVPDGYELVDGKWVRKWRVEKLPPPPPRTFSKMKAVAALMEMGVWEQVKAWIQAEGLYDLYLAAQVFKEDDPYFVKGFAALKTQLNLTNAQAEALLEKCVDK